MRPLPLNGEFNKYPNVKALKRRGGMNHWGGRQNYGPFLDPYYSTAPNV